MASISGHRNHRLLKFDRKKRKDSDNERGLEGYSYTKRGGVRIYKIVVLGDGGVGKSAMALQFVTRSFLECHDPTIEDLYQEDAVIDGEPAQLDILDTAGQVEFTAMREQYMRCGEGFLICYSVIDRRSFEEASEYRKLIQTVRAYDDIPLVLVGNKYDLESQREVSTEEGRILASDFGCPFFETSAAFRTHVDDVFHAIVREIRAKERSLSWRHNSQMCRRWGRLGSMFASLFMRRRRYYGH